MRKRNLRWTVTGSAIALIGFFAIVGCESKGPMSITDINPKVGHTAGEQPIRIVGNNFRQDIGYTVFFGTRKAASVTILDPSNILVTTPSQSGPGSVDVTIRSDDGSAFRIPGGFRYEDMAGDVMGKLGEAREAKKEEKGNLAY
jgi:hypothetical protein